MNSDIVSQIRENVKLLVEERGISMQQFTEEIGVNHAFFNRKHDKAGPGIINISKVADYFGVSIDYLLYNKKNDNNQSKIVAFIEKLIEDTKYGNIVWKQESIWWDYFVKEIANKVFRICRLDQVDFMAYVNMENLLDETLCSWDPYGDNEYPTIWYTRNFEDNNSTVVLKENFYRGKMEDGREFIILNVDEEKEDVEAGWDFYMLIDEVPSVILDEYWEYEKRAVGIYHTTKKKDQLIMTKTQSLIQAIKQCQNCNYISLEAKRILDDYLKLNMDKEGGKMNEEQ